MLWASEDEVAAELKAHQDKQLHQLSKLKSELQEQIQGGSGVVQAPTGAWLVELRVLWCALY